MIKSVLSGSFAFDDSVAAIVPLHRTGVDFGWMDKRAAAQVFDFGRFSPRRGESLIHLLALGDGETVGANRNGDFFPKEANEKYHHTFMKAHYFHDHNNDDPNKSFGRVVAAAYNPPMGRVELIVGLDNEKCAADLAELEKKGEFPVSMSCRVPYDTCMVCGNKAKSRKEYCKHASIMMGRILDNGKMACVSNEHPDFFDISKVWRGADRVAFTFRKLEKAASDGRILSGAEIAEVLGVADVAMPVMRSAFSDEKAYLIEDMSKVASSDLIGFRSALQTGKIADEDLQILKSCSYKGPLFANLHSSGVCLPLDAFLEVANIEKKASLVDIRQSLFDLFSGKSCRTARVCANGSYDGTSGEIPTKVASVIHGLVENYCLFPEVAYGRVIQKSASVGTASGVEKSASAPSTEAELIADEYGAYLVSFAKVASEHCYGHGAFVKNLTALRAFV